jgi:hypothetical protein
MENPLQGGPGEQQTQFARRDTGGVEHLAGVHVPDVCN